MKKISCVAILGGLCFGVPLAAIADIDYQQQGADRYQLSAADVHRLSRKMARTDLKQLLDPMIDTLYFSRDDFKKSLVNKGGEGLVNAHFDDFAKKAALGRMQLLVKAHGDNLVQLSYLPAAVDGLLPESEFVQVATSSASTVNISDQSLRTQALQLKFDADSLCTEIANREQVYLFTVCPEGERGFTLATAKSYQINGLGQEFQTAGSLDSTWNNKLRSSGNKMSGFNGGATGNSQFPVLYASHAYRPNFAVYLDNTYATSWDFRQQPWRVKPSGGESNLYIWTGEDQAQLRHTYMNLVGKPLVPPRKMFGLWLSEYGFDSWLEVDDKLASLKQQQFPIDGVVMDLQWFGGISENDAKSNMGSLTWDEQAFPKPAEKIAAYRQQGLGMMLIEEPYMSEGLAEFQHMEQRKFLVQQAKADKAITTSPKGHWWGKGGMLDWIKPEAGLYWHQWRRQPLIDMGVMAHWTDLGEPEIFNRKGRYNDQLSHKDIHNIYNYKWLESIYRGYQAHDAEQRPFMMSRSGTTGIQRFGAAMWSGDIGSNLSSLAVQFAMQENMMLSGIDYYGSDVGGFHRGGLKIDGTEDQRHLDETYTQWFAYSALFELPLRPHVENLCNCKETAPDRVGSVESNLQHLRLRYQLIPYLYALAHKAQQQGEPIYPSLAYNFPHDPKAQRSDHKMIGEYLLAVPSAKLWQKTLDIYLPAGRWFDYRNGAVFNSERGQLLDQQSLYRNGVYSVPIFAKEGAIVPFNPISDEGLSSEVPDFIGLKIFGLKDSSFTLFEDDGHSTAYLSQQLRQTQFTTSIKGSELSLKVAVQGHYAQAPTERRLQLEWLLPQREVSQVYINGQLQSDWKYKQGWLNIDMPMPKDQAKLELSLLLAP